MLGVGGGWAGGPVVLSCLAGGPGFGGMHGDTGISGCEEMVRSPGYNCDTWSESGDAELVDG